MDPFAATPNGARHELLAELARKGPLHHVVLPTTVPAWVITGYTEARAAFTDPRLVKGGSRNAPYVDELEPETSSGLNNHMRTRLSAHEYPRHVEFVKELPLTATGKIRRLELREREKKKASEALPR